MNSNFIKSILLLTGLVVLTGCVSQPKRDPAFAAVRAPQMAPTPQANGAIYQAGYGNALFEDLKARRVGDIVTIVLEEATDGSMESETSLTKENTTTIASPTLLGQSLSWNGASMSSGLASNSEFDGTGSSDQKNSLKGTIAVTVAEVLPNGNLVVRGEKLMTLNRGDEHIRIAGIIRPVDISPANTISSTKVANAEIVYGGRGELAEANAIGWLARFFISALMPF